MTQDEARVAEIRSRKPLPGMSLAMHNQMIEICVRNYLAAPDKAEFDAGCEKLKADSQKATDAAIAFLKAAR